MIGLFVGGFITLGLVLGLAIGAYYLARRNEKKHLANIGESKTYIEGYQKKLFDVSKSLCDTCQNAMKLKQRYKTTDDNVNFCKVPLQGVTQSLVPTKVMECSEYIECRHYRQE